MLFTVIANILPSQMPLKTFNLVVKIKNVDVVTYQHDVVEVLSTYEKACIDSQFQ